MHGWYGVSKRKGIMSGWLVRGERQARMIMDGDLGPLKTSSC